MVIAGSHCRQSGGSGPLAVRATPFPSRSWHASPDYTSGYGSRMSALFVRPGCQSVPPGQSWLSRMTISSGRRSVMAAGFGCRSWQAVPVISPPSIQCWPELSLCRHCIPVPPRFRVSVPGARADYQTAMQPILTNDPSCRASAAVRTACPACRSPLGFTRSRQSAMAVTRPPLPTSLQS